MMSDAVPTTLRALVIKLSIPNAPLAPSTRTTARAFFGLRAPELVAMRRSNFVRWRKADDVCFFSIFFFSNVFLRSYWLQLSCARLFHLREQRVHLGELVGHLLLHGTKSLLPSVGASLEFRNTLRFLGGRSKMHRSEAMRLCKESTLKAKLLYVNTLLWR